MQAVSSEDRSLFVFAALWNTSLFYNTKLRKHFEDQYLTGDCAGLYLRHLPQGKTRWPNLDVEPATDWLKGKDVKTNKPAELVASTPVHSDAEFAGNKQRFRTLQRNLFWALLILAAIVLYLRH